MNPKLFDSEIKVMNLIWEHEPVSAKKLSMLAEEKYSWNKNTTYTVIKKMEGKGYLKRTDPGFLCTSLISREEVCKTETRGLIERLFGGSRKSLFSALLEDETLTQEELEDLRRMIEKR